MAPEFWCQTTPTEFWCHDISCAKLHFADVTPLLEFTFVERDSGIVKLLIERDLGIVAIKDKKGQSAFHMAMVVIPMEGRLLTLITRFLNRRDTKSSTTIHMATRKGRSQELTGWYIGRKDEGVKMYKEFWLPIVTLIISFLKLPFLYFELCLSSVGLAVGSKMLKNRVVFVTPTLKVKFLPQAANKQVRGNELWKTPRLIFRRYIDLIEIPNDGFPEHYFNFASYNELPARANGRNVIFTESIHQEILQQIASVEEQ
ncbi:hypothetical protein Tco_0691436 [Tanacetum coccineum]